MSYGEWSLTLSCRIIVAHIDLTPIFLFLLLRLYVTGSDLLPCYLDIVFFSNIKIEIKNIFHTAQQANFVSVVQINQLMWYSEING
jgi:hypothetical protein